MRNLKILGLAVVAVTALMALSGTSSAFAANTKLCKENVASCPAAKTYPANTVLKGATQASPTAGAKLVTNLGTVICDSSVEGKTNEAEGTPLKGEVTSLTFSNCTITVGGNTTSCTVTTLHTPYPSSITATGSGNGTLTATKAAPNAPGATVVCGSIINCNFEKESVTLNVFGGAPGVAFAEAKEVALGRSGATCPLSAKWTANYFLTSPTENVFATN
jgi:hypothetical protein